MHSRLGYCRLVIYSLAAVPLLLFDVRVPNEQSITRNDAICDHGLRAACCVASREAFLYIGPTVPIMSHADLWD
eukprot:scaffold6054_cov42-Attheya_sp.AAC.2